MGNLAICIGIYGGFVAFLGLGCIHIIIAGGKSRRRN